MNYDAILINPPYHKRKGSGSVFPLGLGYLKAYLDTQNHSCVIVDLALKINSLEGDFFHEIQMELETKREVLENCILIGIGPVTTACVKSLEAIVCICRDIAKDTCIVCGGPLASIESQMWLFFDVLNVDAIIAGDGEDALVGLIESLKSGKDISDANGVTTPGAIFVRNTLKDINLLPIPYRPPIDMNSPYSFSVRRDSLSKPITTMLTMRGCPYSCSFCVSGNIRKHSKRSMESICTELDHIISEGYKSVIFYDDCLFWGSTINEQIEEFTDRLNQQALCFMWTMELRPDALMNVTTHSFMLLHDSGCKQINVGFESASLSFMEQNNKKFNVDVVKAACLSAFSHGIAITGTFIIGGEQETIATIDKTIELSCSLGLLFAHYTPLEVYPGTPLYERKFGFDEKAWYNLLRDIKYPWGEILFETSELTYGSLLDKAAEAYNAFYTRDTWEQTMRVFFSEDTENVITDARRMILDRYSLGE